MTVSRLEVARLACLVLLLLANAGPGAASSSSGGNNHNNSKAKANNGSSSLDSQSSSAAAASSSSSSSSLSVSAGCSPSCANGRCVNGTCQCFQGWTGHACTTCGGKIKLNSTKGWLADAVGNYSVDSKCTWLIEAPKKSSTIRLHLKEFATECGWDHLYVFDGTSVFAPLKAAYSGLIRQDLYQVQKVPELVGTSGSVLVHFYSDVAYNMTGFNITFSMDACPSEHYGSTCSGHGSCDAESGECACDPDFTGPACSIPACPNNCESSDQQRHGICTDRDGRGKRCHCDRGYTGPSCSQAVSHGFWRVLSPSESPSKGVGLLSGSIPTPRTSHAAMVDEFGKMWLIGGETFANRTRHMVASYEADLSRLDTELGAKLGWWREERAKSDRGPSARYAHSAVLHERKVYMYGGTLWSGHVSKELWSLDLDLLSWEREEPLEGPCGGSERRKVCGPLHSRGHTATVVSNRMIVIFGHSPRHGYLDTVQEYHFLNREWSLIRASGYPVKGGFGHSAVWDEITQKIYVYGGFVSTSSASAAITDQIYSFDPIVARWSLHRASGSFRYLHSAVASHGLMLVFGGNTHNDTATSYGAKCYSADLLVYDIVCDRWHNVQDSIPKELNSDLARFGHSAVLNNGTMLIHGGFHGILKNDLLAYVPGQCQMHKDKESCLKSVNGVKCVWDTKQGLCELHPPNRPKSSIDTCLPPSSPSSLNHSAVCSRLSSCSACVSTSLSCVWCHDRCSWQHCDPDTPKKAKKYTKLDECQKAELQDTPKDWCSHMHKCHSCLAKDGCFWDMDKNSKCKETSGRKSGPGSGLSMEQAAAAGLSLGGASSSASCGLTCSERKNCTNCTHGQCMWCKNLNICIDRNAYLSSFPYGQCMDWTTHADYCPETSSNVTFPENLCSSYQTCTSCRSNPTCGWCDDGTLTGSGFCNLGGAEGPLYRKQASVRDQHLLHSHYEWEHSDVCQNDLKSWHFTTCPACQCNGHSECKKSPGKCDQPCRDHTEGDHCQRCTKGYYGNAVNKGKCQECQCNNQATACNHQTGKCHCTTKGIIGDQCDKCDKVNHYHGDPIKSSCFYDLAIDYQFTFNLSKYDDKHFTGINFKNEPTKVDVDVDFSVSCSVNAKMNLTFRSTRIGPDGHADTKEVVLYSDQNCTLFKERFSKDEYDYGEHANTTFYVYVYDFEPPLWIIISFSQHPKLNLLQFFITFSSCFLALLVVAAILWKIKQRYDRYRRRQRLFVEMEQMASRPFGSVLVELERMPEKSSKSKTTTSTATAAAGVSSSSTSTGRMSSTAMVASAEPGGGITTSASASANLGGGGAGDGAGDAQHHQQQQQQMVVRKRKRRYRPSPIALEPCEGNRAAVLSLIVRLPTGGKPYAPPGYTGIAIASSLVTLGNPRKPSTDVSTRPNVDDVKGRKGRKGPNAQPADI